MDIVELPVLSIEAQLDEALAEMKQKERSAVVAIDGTRCWLFKAGWVVVGLARHEKVLADVENRTRVHLALPTEVDSYGIDLINPTNTWTAVESFLDNVARRSYMITTTQPLLIGQMAAVVTRHESLAVAVKSGPTDCYCTNPGVGDDPHTYSKPLPAGAKCVYDGSSIICF